MWTKKGLTADLKTIIMMLVILAVVIGLFLSLRQVLVANADGVSNTIFGGLGFR